jgi:phosphoribosylanthranilate isomerase
VSRVKICGITNLDDAQFAVESGANALGFNFYVKSPRYITPEAAGEIVRQIPPFMTAVGVFVNSDRDSIERIADLGSLSALQLHGDEAPEFCGGFTRTVIRAIRVGEELEASDIEPYAEAGVNTFLLDTAGQGLYGGTGETFDWSAAVFAKSYGRVILAGGMNPDNVRDGVASVNPYAVDTASGVESEPGIKDHGKVKAFIDAVREENAES